MGCAAQLAGLGLRDGQNTIDFTFGRQRLRAYIYFLHWHTRCASGGFMQIVPGMGSVSVRLKACLSAFRCARSPARS